MQHKRMRFDEENFAGHTCSFTSGTQHSWLRISERLPLGQVRNRLMRCIWTALQKTHPSNTGERATVSSPASAEGSPDGIGLQAQASRKSLAPKADMTCWGLQYRKLQFSSLRSSGCSWYTGTAFEPMLCCSATSGSTCRQ